MVTIDLPHGLSTSIGSLPHSDPPLAASFVLERQPRLPAAPSLPNRSGNERMIPQAAWGLPGIKVLPDGSLGAPEQAICPPPPLHAPSLAATPFVAPRHFLRTQARPA